MLGEKVEKFKKAITQRKQEAIGSQCIEDHDAGELRHSGKRTPVGLPG